MNCKENCRKKLNRNDKGEKMWTIVNKVDTKKENKKEKVKF